MEVRFEGQSHRSESQIKNGMSRKSSKIPQLGTYGYGQLATIGPQNGTAHAVWVVSEYPSGLTLSHVARDTTFWGSNNLALRQHAHAVIFQPCTETCVGSVKKQWYGCGSKLSTHNLAGFPTQHVHVAACLVPHQGCFHVEQQRKFRGEGRSDAVLVVHISYVTVKRMDFVKCTTPSAPSEKTKFMGSGGSLVAVPNLKGIDLREPPGVEPAARCTFTCDNAAGSDTERIDRWITLF